MPQLTLNNKVVNFRQGETLLQIAKKQGIEVPNLCYHPDFKVRAVCRVCVVKVVGQKKLVTACSTKAVAGMTVFTDSPEVRRARAANLQLIFASHREECNDCVLLYDCPLLKYAKDYGLSLARFPDRKNKRRVYHLGQAVEIDGRQCIDCGTCVEVCRHGQKLACLEFAKKSTNQELRPVKSHPCIYCGQCAVHCPVFAAQEEVQWPQVEKLLNNKKKKILVAQVAPSVRATLSESFGAVSGAFSIARISSALKAVGFDYVFDVNFGADVTTMVEAMELIERLTDKRAVLPMMTSCCPAWVRYVEVYQPQLIPHLTTSRSPQLHNAGILKTYWAKQQGIKPEDIIVVSIMPCTAKKFEARRPELMIAKRPLVDFVLTTREINFLLKKKNIDPKKLTDSPIDSPLANFSGASAIYGASGGVMESALRTAAAFLSCPTKPLNQCSSRLEFIPVRGIEGVKEARFKIKGQTLRVAVVSGIGNIEPVLQKLKNYDYIEVMSCPGGCIGGGGQPIPTTKQIVKQRAASLYALDKKLPLRRAHENKEVITVLDWLGKEKIAHQVLHTTYKKSNK